MKKFAMVYPLYQNCRLVINPENLFNKDDIGIVDSWYLIVMMKSFFDNYFDLVVCIYKIDCIYSP